MRARQTGFLKNPFCSAERTNRIRVEPQDAAKGMQYRGETRSVKRAYMDIGPGLERGQDYAALKCCQTVPEMRCRLRGQSKTAAVGARFLSPISLSRNKEIGSRPTGWPRKTGRDAFLFSRARLRQCYWHASHVGSRIEHAFPDCDSIDTAFKLLARPSAIVLFSTCVAPCDRR